MLDTRQEATDALALAIDTARTNGLTIDEIAQMVAAEKHRTQLAMDMAEEAAYDALPVYAEAPPGMIDIATAVKQHGVKAGTVKGWVHRGVVPVLGKVRGLGGHRVLVCEETIIKMAQTPKNKGGRPRKTQTAY